jgi:hypothetical protein
MYHQSSKSLMIKTSKLLGYSYMLAARGHIRTKELQDGRGAHPKKDSPTGM